MAILARQAVLANLILISWFIVTFLFSPGHYTSSPSQSEPLSNADKANTVQLRMHILKQTKAQPDPEPVTMLPGTSVHLAVFDDAASEHADTEKVGKW